ncbi:hypothetical protein AAMO2058_000058900 [Amorphochlora amoebiformis]
MLLESTYKQFLIWAIYTAPPMIALLIIRLIPRGRGVPAAIQMGGGNRGHEIHIDTGKQVFKLINASAMAIVFSVWMISGRDLLSEIANFMKQCSSSRLMTTKGNRFHTRPARV